MANAKSVLVDPRNQSKVILRWGLLQRMLFLGAFWIFVVRRELVPQISLYVVSLAFSGATLCFANCALTFMLPRFELPLLDLTLFRLAVIIATSLDKKMACRAGEQFSEGRSQESRESWLKTG